MPPPIEENGLTNTILLAREGNAAALDALYRQHSPKVLGLCRHLLRSGATAEDVTSEVFMKLSRIVADFDGRLPLERWLARIAANRCLDLLRRQKLERKLFSDRELQTAEPETTSRSPLANLLAEEQREQLRQSIGTLPDRYRLPLLLHYYGELTYDEIASQLALPRDRIPLLIFRAKNLLREALGQK